MPINKISLTIARDTGRTSRVATRKPGPSKAALLLAELLLDELSAESDDHPCSQAGTVLVALRAGGASPADLIRRGISAMYERVQGGR